MFRSSRPIASALAGVLAVSTLGVVLAAAPAAAAAPPPTIRVFIGQGRMVHMPSAIRPGVHRFKIRSARVSSFQILRTRHGYSDRELARDIERAFVSENLTALKRFERRTVLLAGAVSQPGDPAMLHVRLPAGHRYIAVDFNASPAHLRQKFHHFSAAGERLHGRLPQVKTVRAIGETTWAAAPARIRRHGLLGFANNSSKNHFVVLAKLRHGRTVQDWRDYLDALLNGEDPGPDPTKDAGLDSGVVSPGHRMVFRYHVPRGHYVLTCFWPDADMDGLPHAFMGMNRGIVVR